MPYKPILFKKDKDANLYIIVNDDNSAFKPNLNDNEILLDNLTSKDCPIIRGCIDNVRDKGASICCEISMTFYR